MTKIYCELEERVSCCALLVQEARERLDALRAHGEDTTDARCALDHAIDALIEARTAERTAARL